MGPKKAKGKMPVDGVDTTSMSREQLEAFCIRLREELDREREERNFFQLERDKLRTFWEINRQQLEESRAQIRNQDRSIDELEEKHQAEIKVYKQKVKHLLYEHQCNLSELKVEGMVALKQAQDNYTAMEQQLLKDKKDLKEQIHSMELAHLEEVKQLKLEHTSELSKVREQLENDAAELERKYEARIISQAEEQAVREQMEQTELETRKNQHIVDLTKQHETAFQEMKNYYNDITLNNLALISTLKEQMEELKKNHDRMEKQLNAVLAENKKLAEPLKQAQTELGILRRQLGNCELDKVTLANTKQRLCLVTKELEDLRWENDVLESRFEKVEKERDRLHAEFVGAVLDVQQKTGLKGALLEKRMAGMRDAVSDNTTSDFLSSADPLKPVNTNNPQTGCYLKTKRREDLDEGFNFSRADSNERPPTPSQREISLSVNHPPRPRSVVENRTEPRIHHRISRGIHRYRLRMITSDDLTNRYESNSSSRAIFRLHRRRSPLEHISRSRWMKAFKSTVQSTSSDRFRHSKNSLSYRASDSISDEIEPWERWAVLIHQLRNFKMKNLFAQKNTNIQKAEYSIKDGKWLLFNDKSVLPRSVFSKRDTDRKIGTLPQETKKQSDEGVSPLRRSVLEQYVECDNVSENTDKLRQNIESLNLTFSFLSKNYMRRRYYPQILDSLRNRLSPIHSQEHPSDASIYEPDRLENSNNALRSPAIQEKPKNCVIKENKMIETADKLEIRNIDKSGPSLTQSGLCWQTSIPVNRPLIPRTSVKRRTEIDGRPFSAARSDGRDRAFVKNRPLGKNRSRNSSDGDSTRKPSEHSQTFCEFTPLPPRPDLPWLHDVKSRYLSYRSRNSGCQRNRKRATSRPHSANIEVQTSVTKLEPEISPRVSNARYSRVNNAQDRTLCTEYRYFQPIKEPVNDIGLFNFSSEVKPHFETDSQFYDSQIITNPFQISYTTSYYDRNYAAVVTSPKIHNLPISRSSKWVKNVDAQDFSLFSNIIIPDDSSSVTLLSSKEYPQGMTRVGAPGGNVENQDDSVKKRYHVGQVVTPKMTTASSYKAASDRPLSMNLSVPEERNLNHPDEGLLLARSKSSRSLTASPVRHFDIAGETKMFSTDNSLDSTAAIETTAITSCEDTGANCESFSQTSSEIKHENQNGGRNSDASWKDIDVDLFAIKGGRSLGEERNIPPCKEGSTGLSSSKENENSRRKCQKAMLKRKLKATFPRRLKLKLMMYSYLIRHVNHVYPSAKKKSVEAKPTEMKHVEEIISPAPARDDNSPVPTIGMTFEGKTLVNESSSVPDLSKTDVYLITKDVFKTSTGEESFASVEIGQQSLPDPEELQKSVSERGYVVEEYESLISLAEQRELPADTELRSRIYDEQPVISEVCDDAERRPSLIVVDHQKQISDSHAEESEQTMPGCHAVESEWTLPGYRSVGVIRRSPFLIYSKQPEETGLESQSRVTEPRSFSDHDGRSFSGQQRGKSAPRPHEERSLSFYNEQRLEPIPERASIDSESKPFPVYSEQQERTAEARLSVVSEDRSVHIEDQKRVVSDCLRTIDTGRQPSSVYLDPREVTATGHSPVGTAYCSPLSHNKHQKIRSERSSVETKLTASDIPSSEHHSVHNKQQECVTSKYPPDVEHRSPPTTELREGSASDCVSVEVEHRLPCIVFPGKLPSEHLASNRVSLNAEYRSSYVDYANVGTTAESVCFSCQEKMSFSSTVLSNCQMFCKKCIEKTQKSEGTADKPDSLVVFTLSSVQQAIRSAMKMIDATGSHLSNLHDQASSPVEAASTVPSPPALPSLQNSIDSSFVPPLQPPPKRILHNVFSEPFKTPQEPSLIKPKEPTITSESNDVTGTYLPEDPCVITKCISKRQEERQHSSKPRSIPTGEVTEITGISGETVSKAPVRKKSKPFYLCPLAVPPGTLKGDPNKKIVYTEFPVETYDFTSGKKRITKMSKNMMVFYEVSEVRKKSDASDSKKSGDESKSLRFLPAVSKNATISLPNSQAVDSSCTSKPIVPLPNDSSESPVVETSSLPPKGTEEVRQISTTVPPAEQKISSTISPAELSRICSVPREQCQSSAIVLKEQMNPTFPTEQCRIGPPFFPSERQISCVLPLEQAFSSTVPSEEDHEIISTTHRVEQCSSSPTQVPKSQRKGNETAAIKSAVAIEKFRRNYRNHTYGIYVDDTNNISKQSVLGTPAHFLKPFRETLDKKQNYPTQPRWETSQYLKCPRRLISSIQNRPGKHSLIDTRYRHPFDKTAFEDDSQRHELPLSESKTSRGNFGCNCLKRGRKCACSLTKHLHIRPINRPQPRCKPPPVQNIPIDSKNSEHVLIYYEIVPVKPGADNPELDAPYDGFLLKKNITLCRSQETSTNLDPPSYRFRPLSSVLRENQLKISSKNTSRGLQLRGYPGKMSVLENQLKVTSKNTSRGLQLRSQQGQMSLLEPLSNPVPVEVWQRTRLDSVPSLLKEQYSGDSKHIKKETKFETSSTITTDESVDAQRNDDAEEINLSSYLGDFHTRDVFSPLKLCTKWKRSTFGPTPTPASSQTSISTTSVMRSPTPTPPSMVLNRKVLRRRVSKVSYGETHLKDGQSDQGQLLPSLGLRERPTLKKGQSGSWWKES